jgi:hypothetical protein
MFLCQLCGYAVLNNRLRTNAYNLLYQLLRVAIETLFFCGYFGCVRY